MKNKSKSQLVASVGILTALSVALSFLEGLIPTLPFMPPGAKLGLSNIAVMFSAGVYGFIPTLLIAVIKSGFVMLTRGVTAGILSLCGGMLSAAVMVVLLNKTGMGLVGVGVLSAVSHNIGQLIAIMLLFWSFSAIYYIPALIIFGVVFGVITGIVFKLTFPAIKKISRIS